MMTVRMGSEPILSVKQSISIDTMIKFDGDIDGHEDGDGMCKQALTLSASELFSLLLPAAQCEH